MYEAECDGERNYRCNLTVTNPILSSSKLYKTIGDSVQLSIQQSDGKVRWQSENPAVATVNSFGKVTTRGCGETKIRATVDGKILKCKFTTEPVPSLDNLYYMSEIKSYASSSSVAKISEIKNNFDMLKVENVGDISLYEFDNDTIPIYDTHCYSENSRPIGQKYTDIYLIGTSQNARVWVENDLTNKKICIQNQYVHILLKMDMAL